MCGIGSRDGGGNWAPPPTPQMPEDPPSYVDPNIRAARDRARQSAIGKRGFASTNFTSPLGVPDLASISAVKLG